MTTMQTQECHAIIHSASALAAGVGSGMAQIPMSDNAVITPIKLGMAISLGQVFGRVLSDSAARAAIGAASESMMGRTFVQVLVGWIPGIGNAINAATAGGLTEALGWLLAKGFDEGIC